MPSHLQRVTHGIAILLAVLAATFMTVPAAAQESAGPHLIHEYEGWVALAVTVLSLASAGVLIRRAMRR